MLLFLSTELSDPSKRNGSQVWVRRLAAILTQDDGTILDFINLTIKASGRHHPSLSKAESELIGSGELNAFAALSGMAAWCNKLIGYNLNESLDAIKRIIVKNEKTPTALFRPGLSHVDIMPILDRKYGTKSLSDALALIDESEPDDLWNRVLKIRKLYFFAECFKPQKGNKNESNSDQPA